jgi:hypothetical protein
LSSRPTSERTSDDAEDLSGVHVEGDVLEDDLRRLREASLDAQVVDLDHGGHLSTAASWGRST